MKLLYRSRYGIRLTPEGERLYPAVESSVRQYDAMRRSADEISGLETGVVRIGTVSSVSAHWLPQVIRAFWEKHPNVQIVLHQGDYSSIQEWVRNGAVDFGFVNPQAVKGLEDEPEKGGRCTLCYRLRMERAARYAAQHGFEWFTTTLSVSPLKDPVRINQIGLELEEKYGVKHLPNEFRKRDGYKRSLELSAQYGLYRQAYCGCEFSARARGFDEESAAGAAQAPSEK